mmetsp:Transcript_28750/g.73804  ORF Transcript_28750/g.73804 Transcript_28750/m.73804 type:complete len:427 (+) Transcript_28750:392-1672(+)
MPPPPPKPPGKFMLTAATAGLGFSASAGDPGTARGGDVRDGGRLTATADTPDRRLSSLATMESCEGRRLASGSGPDVISAVRGTGAGSTSFSAGSGGGGDSYAGGEGELAGASRGGSSAVPASLPSASGSEATSDASRGATSGQSDAHRVSNSAPCASASAAARGSLGGTPARRSAARLRSSSRCDSCWARCARPTRRAVRTRLELEKISSSWLIQFSVCCAKTSSISPSTANTSSTASPPATRVEGGMMLARHPCTRRPATPELSLRRLGDCLPVPAAGLPLPPAPESAGTRFNGSCATRGSGLLLAGASRRSRSPVFVLARIAAILSATRNTMAVDPTLHCGCGLDASSLSLPLWGGASSSARGGTVDGTACQPGSWPSTPGCASPRTRICRKAERHSSTWTFRGRTVCRSLDTRLLRRLEPFP